MADTLSAVLQGINSGFANGLSLYKTVQEDERLKREERYRRERDGVADARYERQFTREGEQFDATMDFKAEQLAAQQQVAQQKARDTERRHQESLRLGYSRIGAANARANQRMQNDGAKAQQAQDKDNFTSWKGLVGEDGNVDAVLHSVNNTPDGLGSLARTMFGQNVDPQLLQGAELINLRGQIALVRRTADGKSFEPVDLNGDLEGGAMVMPATAFAARFGNANPYLEERATGRNNQATQTLSAAADSAADEAAAYRALEEGALEQGQATSLAAAPGTGLVKYTRYDGKTLYRQPTPEEQAPAKAAAQEALDEAASTAAGFRTQAGGAQSVQQAARTAEQGIAGLSRRFQGNSLFAAQTNIERMLAAGKEPEWFDYRHANLPAHERKAKGEAEFNGLVKDLAGSINGERITTVDGKVKKAPSTEDVAAQTKAALEANPDLLAQAIDNPESRALIRQSLSEATRAGNPGAFPWVLGAYKQQLNGAQILNVARELPVAQGSEKERFALATEVVKYQMANPGVDVKTALGKLQLGQK